MTHFYRLEGPVHQELQTERTGFEPAEPVSQFTDLANRRFRPLSHRSRGPSETTSEAGRRSDALEILANDRLVDNPPEHFPEPQVHVFPTVIRIKMDSPTIAGAGERADADP